MGACASTPKDFVRVGSGLNLRKKHRRLRRRTAQSASHKLSKVETSHSAELSCSNPAYQGSTVVTPRNGDNKQFNVIVLSDPPTKSSEQSLINLEEDGAKVDVSVKETVDNHDEMKDLSHFDKASDHCLDGSSGRSDTATLHNCGLLSNTLLPCIVCSTSSEKKIKPAAPLSPIVKKRLSLKLSFKRREGLANSSLLSPRPTLQRPIAGSQISFCPLEKRMSNSWSLVAPNTFKLRGTNYFRDKKKENAPNSAAFYPFGANVFLSPRKIDHIARFVELPSVDSSGDIPPILVVNLQIQLYPVALFQNDYDGEGISFVFYFKISDKYLEELPRQFQENIKGNKAEDLPECMLCCIRLKEIDFTNYTQLSV